MSASTPQRPSAAVYRRRRLTVLVGSLLALALIAGGILSIVTLSRPLAAAAVEVSEPSDLSQAAAALDLPGTGRVALGASGFDGVIAHSGDQGQAPIASISKIITALVILQAKPLTGDESGPTITYTSNDVAIYNQVVAQDGSTAPVTDGLTLTERQSLTTMLLPSANNYAISLAIWAYGSEDAFVSAANSWLNTQGLTQSHIDEPSGLSANNVSTPANLVQLGQLAEANPVLASIVSQQTADIPGVGTLSNTNTLLGSYGINGIKTGTTDEAGSCLLFSSSFTVGSHTVQLVGVMLGGSSHDAVDTAVADLVQSAQAAFHEVSVTTANGVVGSATTNWGGQSNLVASDDASLLAFGNLPVTVSTTIGNITTGETGSSVGSIVATSGSQQVQVNVQLASSISAPSAWWRLTNSGKLG